MSFPLIQESSNYHYPGKYNASPIDRLNAFCDRLFRSPAHQEIVPAWQRFLFGAVLPWAASIGLVLVTLYYAMSISIIHAYGGLAIAVVLICVSPIWLPFLIGFPIGVANKPWRSRLAAFAAGTLAALSVFLMTLFCLAFLVFVFLLG